MNSLKKITRTYGPKIAEAAFELGAIRLNVIDPFRWVSGYRMPIYNDNRRLLASSKARALVAEGFEAILNVLKYDPDSIAGTATAGIPHATTLADRLGKPLSYVRSSSKGHGLGNQIEGLAKGGTYENTHVLLIEDLISTGLSSTNAVEAIVAAKGQCPYTLAIFTYGFAAAEEAFAALNPKAAFHTILTYEVMLDSALKEGYISRSEAASLEAWSSDPFGWGIERGFMREEG
ncbi:MAG TPA: phosphoribosyltransferase family protein [Sphaerochaeta sp.]|jgi:orotate phosphoribosyltransferase|nr:orotate phosphoribosyltransferase [Spirochaetales bacterium]HQB54685.1 phosphoribosyltransferase family protein [Sphaerochaeta sp.]